MILNFNKFKYKDIKYLIWYHVKKHNNNKFLSTLYYSKFFCLFEGAQRRFHPFFNRKKGFPVAHTA